jgi:signal transduction histidine kinase
VRRRSVRSELFIGMLAVILSFIVGSVVVMDQVLEGMAETEIRQDLVLARQAYDRFDGLQEDLLLNKAWSLAETPFLKATINIPGVDDQTLDHAATSLWELSDVDLLAVLDAQGVVRAELGGTRDTAEATNSLKGVDSALRGESQSYAVTRGGLLYQMALVPILAGPQVVGLLALGVHLDSQTADQLRAVTGRDVMIVQGESVAAESWARVQPRVSDAELAALFAHRQGSSRGVASDSFRVQLGERERIAIVLPLDDSGGFFVLSEALDDVLEPYQRAKYWVFGIGLSVSLLAFLVSRGISNKLSRPLESLTEASQRVASGDFGATVPVVGVEEIQRLAISFNGMAAKIGTLVSDVEKSSRAANAASEAKSLFLANMSHEIRTPLHGILSFARFGIRKSESATREKLLGYFNSIETSGSTLLSLLDDLLDLSKLESGVLELERSPTDLRQVVQLVADEFSSLFRERNLVFRWSVPDRPIDACVDAQRLKQVIRNLLSNASRFSPEGGTIAVEMDASPDLARIIVRDEGPGIPADELETVFDKFIQSSYTKTGAGGTGLGLSICAEIVDAHDGRIWAENNDEEGASFTIELPLSPVRLAP